MVKKLLRLGAPRHSVALVGMDGSGKSTQAEWLGRRLQAQHGQAVLIHPFGRKVLSFLPASKTAGSGGAGTGVSRRPAGLRQAAAVVELLDIAIYTWAAHIRCAALALRGDRDVWLVSDRSFDDLLVKHGRLRTLSPAALALARRLAPVSQTTIWLQTEPAVAMGRDGEFAGSYYQELHARYLAASRQYGWQVIDTSHKSRDEVAADIGRLLGLGPWQTAPNGQGSKNEQEPAGRAGAPASSPRSRKEAPVSDAEALEARQP